MFESFLISETCDVTQVALTAVFITNTSVVKALSAISGQITRSPRPNAEQPVPSRLPVCENLTLCQNSALRFES